MQADIVCFLCQFTEKSFVVVTLLIVSQKSYESISKIFSALA